MRNIIDTYWVSAGQGTFGFVLTEDEFKQTAYMGVCRGDLQELDELYIMDYGSKMTIAQAKGFFGYQINSKTYKR